MHSSFYSILWGFFALDKFNYTFIMIGVFKKVVLVSEWVEDTDGDPPDFLAWGRDRDVSQSIMSLLGTSGTR